MLKDIYICIFCGLHLKRPTNLTGSIFYVVISSATVCIHVNGLVHLNTWVKIQTVVCQLMTLCLLAHVYRKR